MYIKLFPNASIIIDKFQLVQLISSSLTKTRINIMKNDKIFNYTKTAIKTLKVYLPYIKNISKSVSYRFIEGNNNSIKVLKQIAFGFRSFMRFKVRIMICKGLIEIKKEVNA